jgi:hypothetical protein
MWVGPARCTLGRASRPRTKQGLALTHAGLCAYIVDRKRSTLSASILRVRTRILRAPSPSAERCGTGPKSARTARRLWSAAARSTLDQPIARSCRCRQPARDPRGYERDDQAPRFRVGYACEHARRRPTDFSPLTRLRVARAETVRRFLRMRTRTRRLSRFSKGPRKPLLVQASLR